MLGPAAQISPMAPSGNVFLVTGSVTRTRRPGAMRPEPARHQASAADDRTARPEARAAGSKLAVTKVRPRVLPVMSSEASAIP